MQLMRNMLLFFTIFTLTNWTSAAEAGEAIPPELILQQLTIKKNGDWLVVPVRIANKDRVFLVDTGCSTTTVDPSVIPLGEPQALERGGTPQGEIVVKIYAAPDGSIGKIPLQIKSVAGMDLKTLRESSGYPIEGILGMDFLGRHIVHLDFDQGKLLFLKSVPKGIFNALSTQSNSGETPVLDAWVSPVQKIRFIVDTGLVSFDSGLMSSPAMRSLVKSGDYREVSSTLKATAGGIHTYKMYQGKRVSLDKFFVDRPIFSETPSVNVLGLGFLSRFAVTFDFPGSKIYLQKGEGYERPDLRDLSGLHLRKNGRELVVNIVDKGSSGSLAGFQAGDVLLKLGTWIGDETSLFEAQRALCREGQLVCLVRRGDIEGKMTLNIKR